MSTKLKKIKSILDNEHPGCDIRLEENKVGGIRKTILRFQTEATHGTITEFHQNGYRKIKLGAIGPGDFCWIARVIVSVLDPSVPIVIKPFLES